LVAGRELGLHVGIATLAATEIGTITFMYFAESGYKRALRRSARRPSRFVMIIVGRHWLVVSRFRELKLMTVPDTSRSSTGQGLAS